MGPEYKLPESYFIVHFVCGFGEDFRAWAQVFWTLVGTKIPILADVVLIAEGEETRMGRTDQSALEKVLAMMAKSDFVRGRKRAATTTNLEDEEVVFKKPKCGYCGKIGHVKAGCWDLYLELKKTQKRRGKKPREDSKRETREAMLAMRPRRGGSSDSDIADAI